MKSFLLATCAVLVPAVGSAQAQLAAWQGSVTFKNLAPAANCQNAGFSPGSLATGVYRAHLNSGEPPAALSIVGSRGVTILFDQGAHPTLKATNAPYSGFYIGGRATTQGQSPFSGTYTLNIVPATITATTNQVTVTGNIKNFFNNTGCTATIEGSFFLRP